MVKVPQGTLGYCVDGKVVRRPVSRPTPASDPPVNPHRGAAKKMAKNKSKRVSNSSSKKKPSMRPIAADACLTFHPDMDLLKNASKTDDLQEAALAIKTILGLVRHGSSSLSSSSTSDSCLDPKFLERLEQALRHTSLIRRELGNDSGELLFRAMMRVLSARDLEHRSPLYHAAHCGHPKMVRRYLCLMITWQVSRRPSKWRRNAAKMTGKPLGDWLQIDKDHFQICVTSALNQEVRDVMIKEKWVLKDILAVAQKCRPAFPVPSLTEFSSSNLRTVRGKKSRGRPSLAVDDETDDPQELLFYDHPEFFYQEDEPECDYDGQNEYFGDDDEIPVHSSTSNSSVEPSLVSSEESVSRVEEEDRFIGAHDEDVVVEETMSWEDDSLILADEDDSFSDSEFVSFTIDDVHAMLSLGHHGVGSFDDVIDDGDSWEHVGGDAKSVQSEKVVVRSYRDVADISSNQAFALPRWTGDILLSTDLIDFPSRPKVETGPVKDDIYVSSEDLSVVLPELESVYDDIFYEEGSIYTYEFFRDGVKDARGGRVETMFKGNPKTEKKKGWVTTQERPSRKAGVHRYRHW